MIAFIDGHREAHGQLPSRNLSICKVLPIAPSTYHDHAAKRADPEKQPARTKRDAALKGEIRRVFEENFRVYGVRKVWRQLKREGADVARCTVARLMQANIEFLGIARSYSWQKHQDNGQRQGRTLST